MNSGIIPKPRRRRPQRSSIRRKCNACVSQLNKCPRTGVISVPSWSNRTGIYGSCSAMVRRRNNPSANFILLQFRIGSLPSNTTNNRAARFRRGASLRNLERSELLRNDLRYLKLTVLRNRKRFFFFGESDLLDTFGPGSV